MRIKYESREQRIVCDGCGFSVNTEDEYNKHFNTDDTTIANNSFTYKDYCLKCHPKRMTYLQLIEWLAKGNGYVCQQVRGYSTSVNFHMGNPIEINGAKYYHAIDDQIEYDEHELVVRYFDTNKNVSYWNIPTEAMFLRDCRQTPVPESIPEPVSKPLSVKKPIWQRMWGFLNRPIVIVRH